MKLNREDFKGIEEELGWSYVEEIRSSGSIVYRTELQGDLKVCVGVHFDYGLNAIVASVSVYGKYLSINRCNGDLQTPEEVVQWVIKMIRSLEYYANELKDL